MNKKKVVLSLLVLTVLAGIGWWQYQRHVAGNQAASASNQGAATQRFPLWSKPNLFKSGR